LNIITKEGLDEKMGDGSWQGR